MPTRNVSLTPHLDQFVEAGITSGRFSNASEVVREALRLLEERDAHQKAKLAWLRGAATEAFASIDRGEGIELRSHADIDALLQEIWQDVETEASKARV